MNKHLRLLTTVLVLAAPHGMAGELAFAEQETPAATIYNLQLRDETGVRTIWSRQVPLINGKKPYDYCSLISWGQNEHGLLAVVYYNEFFGRLLQFDPTGRLMAEIEVGGKWIEHKKRFERIQIEPPDKITVSTSKGIISEVIIRDGQLYNPGGEPFVENPLIAQLAAEQKQKSKTTSGINPSSINPPFVTKATSPSTHDLPASTGASMPSALTPWLFAGVFIVAVVGLLWLLLKRRS